MPLEIIRQDITNIYCDAIVNPTNETLIPGGGIDAKIHKKAGPRLASFCSLLGGIKIGEAKLTPAFDLKCQYIIHTAGPVWWGGNNNEEALLKSCYKSSLELALKYNLSKIAVPLISTGAYNFPKGMALRIAIDAVSEFLVDNEMMVYIVVFDKDSYSFSQKLYDDITAYIDDNYVEKESTKVSRRVRSSPRTVMGDVDVARCLDVSLKDMLEEIDDSFSVALMKLIDIKGMSDVECYKKANVSKQTWYKIMNSKSYKPSKNTVISFAIALELTLEEAKELLATVGFTLSKSSKFDIIIEYFLINKKYDIIEINEALFEFDQSCLGA